MSAPVQDYTIIVRDWQTLEIVGWITTPQAASWTHRLYAAGDFRVTFYDPPGNASVSQIMATDLFIETANGEWDVIEHVVEIRRNGEFEFAGLIDYGTLDDATGRIMIAGLDLLASWLNGRIIIPASGQSTDSQVSVGAGAALEHYVTDHLIAPSDASRDVDSELAGVTMTAGTFATGNTITYHPRYLNLHTAALALARIGDLVPLIDFNADYSQYVVSAAAPVDKTIGNDPVVVFSAERGTGEVQFISERRTFANAAVVLGQGEGTGRTQIARTNADDLAAHRRREVLLDARNVPTRARLTVTANPVENETVTIGAKTYRFRDPGNLAAANDVLIGAARDESLYNLRQAIAGGAGSGTLYHASTTANTAVFAPLPSGDVLEVVASGTTTPVATTETLSAGSWDVASIDLAALQAYGDAELGNQTVRAKSIIVDVNLGRITYRDDFELGDDVTALIERLDARFDRRIVEVAVAIDERSFETVRLTLGYPPATLTQRLAGSLSQVNTVIAE